MIDLDIHRKAHYNPAMSSAGVPKYIWESADWPEWRYDLGALTGQLERVSRGQGMLMGRMSEFGLPEVERARMQILAEEVVRTSEIEGEHLEVDSVRSSIARRLGIEYGALTPVDRRTEGVVGMVLDATLNHREDLTVERLGAWHRQLFVDGGGLLGPLRVGMWRDDQSGPMQVVSGPIGRRRVHFQAPPAIQIPQEMDRFLAWVNGVGGSGGMGNESPLIRAGLAHLWFITIHPFEDGNGRIARAIGDMLLARAEGTERRFYSLSAQIQRERKSYYEILERTQKGTLEVTEWLRWFLQTLDEAIWQAMELIDGVLERGRFWKRLAGHPFNERQVRMLNRLLEGVEGKLTTGKWAVIAKCSSDTALRDIGDLVAKGVLRRAAGGGRSTSYELVQDMDLTREGQRSPEQVPEKVKEGKNEER